LHNERAPESAQGQLTSRFRRESQQAGQQAGVRRRIGARFHAVIPQHARCRPQDVDDDLAKRQAWTLKPAVLDAAALMR